MPTTTKSTKAEPKTKTAKPRGPVKRPTLDDDERRLLIASHLDKAAEALGLNPEAGAKITGAAWGKAIEHYQRAEKLAGGTPVNDRGQAAAK